MICHDDRWRWPKRHERRLTCWLRCNSLTRPDGRFAPGEIEVVMPIPVTPITTNTARSSSAAGTSSPPGLLDENGRDGGGDTCCRTSWDHGWALHATETLKVQGISPPPQCYCYPLAAVDALRTVCNYVCTYLCIHIESPCRWMGWCYCCCCCASEHSTPSWLLP
jgi:hypothetical protein